MPVNEGSNGGGSSAGAAIVAVTSRVTPGVNISKNTSAYSDITSVDYPQATPLQVLDIAISGSLRAEAAVPSAANIRVLYDGVDVGVFPVVINVIAEHQQYSFRFTITGAETSGVKVCKLQWARRSGTGTLNYDPDDCHILRVRN